MLIALSRNLLNIASIAGKILALFVISCASSADSILIENTNIIDTAELELRLNVDILIRDSRIQFVRETGQMNVPNDAMIVDGSSKFVIPGLWDMHTHWTNENETYLGVFIANGVTGVRQMFGDDIHYNWRTRQFNEDFIGPKTLIGTPLFDGVPKWSPLATEIPNAEVGRNLVREYRDKGVDFVKVYTYLNRETYLAIADESKKLGIAFVGHVPNSITDLEASDLGQKSLEHIPRLEYATSTTAMATLDQYRDLEMTNDLNLERLAIIRSGYGGEYTNTLFETFVKNDTWITPTLTVFRNLASLRERAEIEENNIQYFPIETTQYWNVDGIEGALGISGPEDYEWRQVQLDQYKLIVRDMHEAGVRLLAGTDNANPFVSPGFSLHDELKLFVDSGLSPLEALRTATYNPAEFMGKLDDYGTVSEGKRADLVILEADPQVDIENSKAIYGVILNGSLYEKTQLERVLDILCQSYIASPI